MTTRDTREDEDNEVEGGQEDFKQMQEGEKAEQINGAKEESNDEQCRRL